MPRRNRADCRLREIGCRSRARGAPKVRRHAGRLVERGPSRGRGEPKTDPWPRRDGPAFGACQIHPTAFRESLVAAQDLPNYGGEIGLFAPIFRLLPTRRTGGGGPAPPPGGAR